MSQEIECDKLFTAKLTLKHYDEETEETVQEKLFWTASDQADIGWCAGIQIATAIERLFPGTQQASDRRDCFRAIMDCFDTGIGAGDYKHLKG